MRAKEHRGEGPLSSFPRPLLSMCLIPCNVDLEHMVEVCPVRLLFLLLPYTVLRSSPQAQHPRERAVELYLLEGQIAV